MGQSRAGGDEAGPAGKVRTSKGSTAMEREENRNEPPLHGRGPLASGGPEWPSLASPRVQSQERTPHGKSNTTSGTSRLAVEGAQIESELNILKLISAGSPLPDVLATIARLVESQGKELFCTIWLPDEEVTCLYCAAAPSLPGFGDHVGRTQVGPKGASCGTAIYRREPVYVTDIFTERSWDDYRHLMVPFGIRSVWSRPLFTSEGKVLGTFAILHREPRSPRIEDLQLIENASHITGIAM